MSQSDSDPRKRIVELTLDERTVVRRSPEIEHERAVAIFDILEENCFEVVGDESGPYRVHLMIEENRLVLEIGTSDRGASTRLPLALNPFRRIVKDYFTVCESYYAAIKRATPGQIEAIDMGRRGLHDEGAELLRQRLGDKVVIDKSTARRLFTLLCVLHIRG